MRGPDSTRASRVDHDRYINLFEMCDVVDGDSKTTDVLLLRYACAESVRHEAAWCESRLAYPASFG